MAHHVLTLRDQRGVEHAVTLGTDGSVTVGDRTLSVARFQRGELRVGNHFAWVAIDGDLRWVFLDGQVYTFELHGAGTTASSKSRHPASRTRRAAGRDGGLSAPMPATVVKILAVPGDQVKAGDVLIILEAMKMELPVRTAVDGIVRSVRCREGELVQPGADLVELASPGASPASAEGQPSDAPRSSEPDR